jgi:hypothetical protein
MIGLIYFFNRYKRLNSFFYPHASSMALFISPKTLRETLLLRAANPLTIGEVPVIDFTTPMIRLTTSMMFIGASMKFSRLENFIELVFDCFVML